MGYDAPYNIQVVELIEYIDPDNDIKKHTTTHTRLSYLYTQTVGGY
jgi:hypothetical protein